PPEQDLHEIADRDLEDRKKESRVPQDDSDRSGELLPEYRRLPECLPRSRAAKRVQICRAHSVEGDRVETLAENTEPTKPHAPGVAVQQIGRTVDLEGEPLGSGRIAKMVEVAKEILDFEPDGRLRIVATARAFFGFIGIRRRR